METPIAIFFYSQNNDRYGYLSNFYHCTFHDDDGHVFSNSEQYYAYWKCKCFEPENAQLLDAIMNEIRPMVVKQMAHKIANFNKTIWDGVCVDVMYNALVLKFTQNADLHARLVSTSSKQLYEASPTDAIWGIGMSCISAIKTQSNKYGKNLLGKTLMELRNQLLSGQPILLRPICLGEAIMKADIRQYFGKK